jgi:hypothetical protein
MSDEDEDYDEGEDDEEEEGEEEGEEGEEEGEVDEEAVKSTLVKEDIAMLMDVFGYIDRTSKRLASRLANESLASNRGAGGGGHKGSSSLFRGGGAGGAGAGGADRPQRSHNHAGTKSGAGDNEDSEEDGGGGGGEANLNGGWSQYEHMSDADRGLLLEKAILALGINDNAAQLSDRRQYEADGNAAGQGSRKR